MKRIGWFFMLVFISGCGTAGQENKFFLNTYKSETTDEKGTDCSSLSPDNPYAQDSGHYAGYEWGEEGNNCSGNSQSFIEGCEDYVRQEADYSGCLSH